MEPERGRVRITVVGKSPSWQDADGACSGYLVEEGPTALLLDCGNGVFSKLRTFRDYCAIDAVVISHLHADHFLDLVPYSYALTYAPRQQPVPVDRWPGTDTPGAPGAARAGRRRASICAASSAPGATRTWSRTRSTCASTTPTRRPEVGPMRVRFHDVPHFVETHAVDITLDQRGGRFTFGADSRPRRGARRVRPGHRPADARGDAAAPRARRAARPPHPRRGGRPRPPRRRRGAWSSPTSPTSWTRAGPSAEAAKAFGGPVEVAREGRGLRPLSVWQSRGRRPSNCESAGSQVRPHRS